MKSLNTKHIWQRAADYAYTVIKDWIMEGSIGPGEKLVEDELVKHLQVSKTPLREALNRLRGEGLIINSSVVSLSDQDIIALCQLRSVMEVICIEAGFEKLKDQSAPIQSHLTRLQRALDGVEKGQSTDWPREIYLLNEETDKFLESLLLEAANINVLSIIGPKIKGLIELTRRKWSSPERSLATLRDHIKILEGMLAGDKEETKRRVLGHIQNQIKKMLQGSRYPTVMEPLLPGGYRETIGDA